MTVTVTGNDLEDVRRKVHANHRTPDISITVRDSDFGRVPLLGYVVTVGRKIPLEFKDARSAVAHLLKTLKEHEASIRLKIAQQKKDAAVANKAAKKK
jgi:hypothetical protein